MLDVDKDFQVSSMRNYQFYFIIVIVTLAMIFLSIEIQDAEEKELYMTDLLQQLPKPNKLTALYLLEHLRRYIHQYSIFYLFPFKTLFKDRSI